MACEGGADAPQRAGRRMEHPLRALRQSHVTRHRLLGLLGGSFGSSTLT